MGGDFVSTIFSQQSILGEPLPQRKWGRVLVYNKLNGGVVFEQYRSTVDPCAGPGEFTETLQCYLHNTDSVEAFGKPIEDLGPGFAPWKDRQDRDYGFVPG